jgi:lysophospholipase L1-like esterase
MAMRIGGSLSVPRLANGRDARELTESIAPPAMLATVTPTTFLLPIALVQGLWVRQTVPRLPPARGRRGRYGTGPHDASIVGIGDSIIAGVGVDRQEQALVGHLGRRLHERTGEAVRWQACGLNGADSATILERIVPHAPAADVYVISAGVNDAVRGVSPARFARHLEVMVRALRERSPAASIVFAGIPPLERFPALPWPLGALLGERAARLQAAARELAPRLDVVCFDFPPGLPDGGFAPDGFHPAPEACDVWAGWLLETWLSRPPRPAASAPGSASPPG